MNTDLLQKMAEPGYDVKQVCDDLINGNNDQAWIDYYTEVAQLKSDINGLTEEEKLNLPIGGNLLCGVLCFAEYVDCRHSNPYYPPASICDTYLTNCLINCPAGI